MGELIRRKRVDLLLSALKSIGSSNWCLDVVGDGVERSSLTQKACSLGLSNRVAFLGKAPNAEIHDAIRRADVLVLPSYADGWGAVVNEALACGVPVLVSDHCGAKDVVKNGRGSIFVTDSVTSLSSSIAECIARGPLSAQEKRAIQVWSQFLSPATGAAYLRNVIEMVNASAEETISSQWPKPQAPWLDTIREPLC